MGKKTERHLKPKGPESAKYHSKNANAKKEYEKNNSENMNTADKF